MKTTTIAATAAILGSVSADGWEGWSNSTDATTSSADPTWTEWSSTTKSADPTTDSTWSEWSSTTPVATSTDPSWGTWDPTSSKPADKTSSSSWSEWSSTSTSSDPAWSEWNGKKSSTTPVATSSSTWSEWSSTSADPSTTTNWGSWDPEPTSTLTSTSTKWITVTVYPNDGGQTWSEWSTPAAQTTTDSWTVWVSSTVTKTASATTDGAWSSWTAPALAVDPGCKLQVSVSYGLPIWKPTPSVNWDDWSSASASSTPDAKTSTSSWAEWDPASSKPVTATSSSSWVEWDGSSTTSKPVTATSTASWGEWDGSDKEVAKTTGSASWDAWSSGSSASKTSSSGSAASTWGEWSSDNNGISANGNKFGMTYSPYTADSQCKDASTVASDIAAMAAKGFTSVRVYSTDCQTLENVGKAARDNKMKVILGVFISKTGISGAQPQVDAIVAWKQWDLVELIVVGNEAVFSGYCSASDLKGFISSSKQAFKAAGFTGAVSTTDELSVWQSSGSDWCDVVDVVTANLYAFFNANTAAEDAGSFIQSEITALGQICPGKEVYVMESGWPSAGECNGKACPSPENQATAIKGIQAAVGAKVVFFSFEDEQWKAPGQFGVEQHWGCSEVFQ